MRAAFVLRLAAAGCALVCVGVLAACAAEPASTPSGQEPSDSAPAPATPADAATEVRVEVSGGITGAHRVYELTRDAPPRDLSPRAARAVLRLADTAAVRDLDEVRLRRPVPCCDRQVMDVSVTYADGSHTRVRTAELASVPPQLRRMVALLTGAP
jgi:hypothetical protein